MKKNLDIILLNVCLLIPISTGIYFISNEMFQPIYGIFGIICLAVLNQVYFFNIRKKITLFKNNFIQNIFDQCCKTLIFEIKERAVEFSLNLEIGIKILHHNTFKIKYVYNPILDYQNMDSIKINQWISGYALLRKELVAIDFTVYKNIGINLLNLTPDQKKGLIHIKSAISFPVLDKKLKLRGIVEIFSTSEIGLTKFYNSKIQFFIKKFIDLVFNNELFFDTQKGRDFTNRTKAFSQFELMNWNDLSKIGIFLSKIDSYKESESFPEMELISQKNPYDLPFTISNKINTV